MTNANTGRRQTVETRRKKQKSQHARLQGKYKNRDENWKSDALDLYLAGVPVPDICAHYEIRITASLYNLIAREALLRLMEASHAQRLDEVRALQEDCQ